MIAARRSACFAALARMSSTSTLPLASQRVTTTVMPHICAEAGLVPCADSGIRHTSRWPSPRERWYARIASRPANSPCAPELGWRSEEHTSELQSLMRISYAVFCLINKTHKIYFVIYHLDSL